MLGDVAFVAAAVGASSRSVSAPSSAAPSIGAMSMECVDSMLEQAGWECDERELAECCSRVRNLFVDSESRGILVQALKHTLGSGEQVQLECVDTAEAYGAAQPRGHSQDVETRGLRRSGAASGADARETVREILSKADRDGSFVSALRAIYGVPAARRQSERRPGHAKVLEPVIEGIEETLDTARPPDVEPEVAQLVRHLVQGVAETVADEVYDRELDCDFAARSTPGRSTPGLDAGKLSPAQDADVFPMRNHQAPRVAQVGRPETAQASILRGDLPVGSRHYYRRHVGQCCGPSFFARLHRNFWPAAFWEPAASSCVAAASESLTQRLPSSLLPSWPAGVTCIRLPRRPQFQHANCVASISSQSTPGLVASQVDVQTRPGPDLADPVGSRAYYIKHFTPGCGAVFMESLQEKFRSFETVAKQHSCCRTEAEKATVMQPCQSGAVELDVSDAMLPKAMPTSESASLPANQSLASGCSPREVQHEWSQARDEDPTIQSRTYSSASKLGDFRQLPREAWDRLLSCFAVSAQAPSETKANSRQMPTEEAASSTSTKFACSMHLVPALPEELLAAIYSRFLVPRCAPDAARESMTSCPTRTGIETVVPRSLASAVGSRAHALTEDEFVAACRAGATVNVSDLLADLQEEILGAPARLQDDSLYVSARGDGVWPSDCHDFNDDIEPQVVDDGCDPRGLEAQLRAQLTAKEVIMQAVLKAVINVQEIVSAASRAATEPLARDIAVPSLEPVAEEPTVEECGLAEAVRSLEEPCNQFGEVSSSMAEAGANAVADGDATGAEKPSVAISSKMPVSSAPPVALQPRPPSGQPKAKSSVVRRTLAPKAPKDAQPPAIAKKSARPSSGQRQPSKDSTPRLVRRVTLDGGQTRRLSNSSIDGKAIGDDSVAGATGTVAHATASVAEADGEEVWNGADVSMRTAQFAQPPPFEAEGGTVAAEMEVTEDAYEQLTQAFHPMFDIASANAAMIAADANAHVFPPPAAEAQVGDAEFQMLLNAGMLQQASLGGVAMTMASADPFLDIFGMVAFPSRSEYAASQQPHAHRGEAPPMVTIRAPASDNAVTMQQLPHYPQPVGASSVYASESGERADVRGPETGLFNTAAAGGSSVATATSQPQRALGPQTLNPATAAGASDKPASPRAPSHGLPVTPAIGMTEEQQRSRSQQRARNEVPAQTLQQPPPSARKRNARTVPPTVAANAAAPEGRRKLTLTKAGRHASIVAALSKPTGHAASDSNTDGADVCSDPASSNKKPSAKDSTTTRRRSGSKSGGNVADKDKVQPPSTPRLSPLRSHVDQDVIYFPPESDYIAYHQPILPPASPRKSFKRRDLATSAGKHQHEQQERRSSHAAPWRDSSTTSLASVVAPATSLPSQTARGGASRDDPRPSIKSSLGDEAGQTRAGGSRGSSAHAHNNAAEASGSRRGSVTGVGTPGAVSRHGSVSGCAGAAEPEAVPVLPALQQQASRTQSPAPAAASQSSTAEPLFLPPLDTAQASAQPPTQPQRAQSQRHQAGQRPAPARNARSATRRRQHHQQGAQQTHSPRGVPRPAPVTPRAPAGTAGPRGRRPQPRGKPQDGVGPAMGLPSVDSTEKLGAGECESALPKLGAPRHGLPAVAMA